jgi:hypothetical protein
VAARSALQGHYSVSTPWQLLGAFLMPPTLLVVTDWFAAFLRASCQTARVLLYHFTETCSPWK